MSALKDLLNRYNEGDKLTDLETLIITARDEKAAEELAIMKEERNKIAKHIRVTLDDGTAPDNLVDHVLFVMIHEYDPMVQRIHRLEAELKALKGDE